MLDFEVYCYDSSSPACGRNMVDLYNAAGQIISDNLVLNRRISVDINVQNNQDEEYFGNTYPTQVPYGDPENGVVIYYPTALLKQLDPNFAHEGPDISIEINSKFDDDILYFRTDPIQPHQVDFLELVLHELQHGLGIVTFWSIVKDDDLIPAFDYQFDESGVLTFYNFDEFIFDKYIVSLGNNNEKTSTYVQAINGMVGPSGKTYNTEDDFYNELRAQQQQAGKEYTKNMLVMATNLDRLGFLPNNAPKAITLDTSYDPYEIGKSIIHLDEEVYQHSSDFLLIPEMAPGKKLEDKIAAYGNAPGGGIGPQLRLIYESMGYESRINPTGSTNPLGSVGSTNSTKSPLGPAGSKSKEPHQIGAIRSIKNKPKRIVKYPL